MSEAEAKVTKQKESLLKHARTVFQELGHCVYHGGEFWKRHETVKVWYSVDRVLKNSIVEATGGHQVDKVLKLMEYKYSLPGYAHTTTPYYKWVGDGSDWPNDGWKPFTARANQLVFGNGLLDLSTGEITKHEGLWGPTISVDVESLPDIRAGNPWPEKFSQLIQTMEDGFADAETLECFQACMSFILRPHVHFRHGIWILGDAGSRKSTIATALCSAPGGAEGIARISERRLGHDERFASSGLVGKFVNFSDDMGGDAKFRDWFKSYTGNPTFQGEFKYSNSRPYSATAKLVSCCNQLPKLFDASDAIASRMLIFQFAKKHVGGAEPELVSLSPHLDADYWNDDATRAHILAWLVEGARRVAAAGNSIPKPKSMVISIDEHIQATDPVRTWLEDNLEITFEKAHFLKTADILQHLAESGITCDGQSLASYMVRTKLKPTRHQVSKGVFFRGYDGVRFRNTGSVPPVEEGSQSKSE